MSSEASPRRGARRLWLAAWLIAAMVPAPASSHQSSATPAAPQEPPTGIASVALAPDGRAVLASAGDLWLAPARQGEPVLEPGALVRLTAGAAWDRDPAWTPSGAAIVFASDRAGSLDLWEVSVGPDGTSGEPRPLTDAEEPEIEPAVAPDGTIVFVRGDGPEADLWALGPGSAAPWLLAQEEGAQTSPTISPDGTEVAYVSERRGRRSLVRRPLTPAPAPAAEGDQTEDAAPAAEEGDTGTGAPEVTVIRAGEPVAYPSWGPEGRIVYTRQDAEGGLWVTPADGSYANLVSEQRARAVWSADGARLLLVAVPRPDPAYNGDPARLDRLRGGLLEIEGGSWWTPAPPAPFAGPVRALSVPLERAARNAALFDEVFARARKLYERPATAHDWDQLGREHRPLALAAGDEDELQQALHAMLRARPPARAEARGAAAVSSAHPLASAAGIEILAAGGNVVDAAVSVSFALGVVEPDASGVGGYGEMLVYLQGMEQPVVIEFLTRVPERAGLLNGELVGSRVPDDGPVVANVPGTVRGMELAWRRYGSGRLEWARLLEPAIRLAEEGFELDEAFPTTLARERDRYLQYESSRELFFPDGQPLRAGQRFRNPDLAWTLRRIAEGGADAFYEGPVARRMVEDLRGKGNAITGTDMARYFAAERPPVVGSYRDHTVFSAAPAVSGGAALVAQLHLLDRAPEARDADDPDALHALIEAVKLAPSLRGLVADPGLWPVDLAPVTDRNAAAQRWSRCFDPARASGPEELAQRDEGPPQVLACEEQSDEPTTASWGQELWACENAPGGCRADGTSAFAVGDAAGNLVAATQTLGTWGGNFYVTPGLGFLYNDKLRSYGSNPGDYGARIPFARNGTSIAPTLVFRGSGAERTPWVALGAAGNAWIGAAVYRMVGAIVDLGLGPQQALELPRFLVGVRRDPRDRDAVREIVVQYEDLVDPNALRQLRARGHVLQPISLRGQLRMGYGAAVMVQDGVAVAGADPRRSGGAAAQSLAGASRPAR